LAAAKWKWKLSTILQIEYFHCTPPSLFPLLQFPARDIVEVPADHQLLDHKQQTITQFLFADATQAEIACGGVFGALKNVVAISPA
jgi:hypothetical protein